MKEEQDVIELFKDMCEKWYIDYVTFSEAILSIKQFLFYRTI